MNGLLQLGLTAGVPEGLYHRGVVDGEPSLSHSGMKTLLGKSPEHFRHEVDHPEDREQKKYFDLGSAVHAYVLGAGRELVAEIRRGPATRQHPFGSGEPYEDYRTKDCQAKRDHAYSEGLVPILAKDVARVHEMVTALRRHPKAGELLEPGSGTPEVSAFARDPESGVLLRARFDWLRHDGVVVDFKGLALDTLLPTPTGWTTMDAVTVGDQLFGSDGSPCTVTAKSSVHWNPCYRLTFDDGSTVVCDHEHRWAVRSGTNRYRDEVLTTQQIASTIFEHGQRHHRVAVARSLDLPERTLPVDPYVLGVWLGDGSRGSGRVTKSDDELFALVEARGYTVAPIPDSPSTSGKAPTRTVYGLAPQLREADVLHAKRIPGEYLRAGRSQRIALLRGLLDTDGTWNRTRHQAVFSSVDEALTRQVLELVLGLGQRATMHKYRAHGPVLAVDAYRVVFRPVGLNPFSLSRKASLVQTNGPGQSDRRIIVAAEPVATVPTQCISVDSPDRTYLCTAAMIPTHNTTSKLARPAGISRSLYDLGYYLQAATYSHVAALCGLELTGFEFVMQETSPPYAPSVFHVGPASVELGRVRMRQAVDLYAECVASGVWPGYPAESVEVDVPFWALRELDALPATDDDTDDQVDSAALQLLDHLN